MFLNDIFCVSLHNYYFLPTDTFAALWSTETGWAGALILSTASTQLSSFVHCLQVWKVEWATTLDCHIISNFGCIIPSVWSISPEYWLFLWIWGNVNDTCLKMTECFYFDWHYFHVWQILSSLRFKTERINQRLNEMHSYHQKNVDFSEFEPCWKHLWKCESTTQQHVQHRNRCW